MFETARRLLQRAALLALLPLALVAGWLYLYAHSHAVDTDEQNRTLVRLKDLKQLDSDWSANVLRSHADINPNYDALAEPLARFASELATLREPVQGAHDGGIADALARLGVAVEAKAALIDDFKAQNSLFKNSLRYVPTAHKAMAAQLPDTRLAFLVNESMRYSAVPDGELAQSLRAGVDELRASPARYPPALREPVANLLAHLDTLLRLRSQQTELLRAISQVPVAPRIDALAAAFTSRFDEELAGQFRYQRLLLAYSAVALLLVIAGAVFIGYRGATERHRLRSLVDEQTRELKALATRDELTQVHNRRHMTELLEQQLGQHARGGQPLCLALLDIDLFKSINDRHGHAAGDAVLVRFAAVAGRTLRTMDLLGRWGGEEFLVALPHTSLEHGMQALNRMRSMLDSADFSDLAAGLRVTFSGGLVVLATGETIAAAVERADQAMYRAKTAGRNRIETG